MPTQERTRSVVGKLGTRGASVERGVCFLEPTAVQGQRIAPTGIMLWNEKTKPFEGADDFLIVQPGLPGTSILGMLEKAGRLVRSHKKAQVFLATPPGMKDELLSGASEKLGLEHGKENFTFGRYKRLLAAAYQSTRPYLRPDARVHLVGHSYGAAALLFALKHIQEARLPFPESVHFLAPFVKLALDSNDPNVCLNIFNTAVHGAVSKPHQKRRLKSLLGQMGQYYRLSPSRDLVHDHGTNFDRQFYDSVRTIGDISRTTRARIWLAGKDEYVDESHADLVASSLGEIRERIEKTIDAEDHELNELEFKTLLQAT